VVVVEAHTLQTHQQEGRVEALRASALDQEVLVTLHLLRQVKAMLAGQTR
jgi:hypothetical protein